jgi:Domain of unknown function (DUF4259)
MGAWGIHFDECDGSLDFLGDVEESRDWNDVRHRVRDYVANGGYDDAEEAIAALELIAAARNKASPRLSTELQEWSGEQTIGADDQASALAAVDLVIEKSELSELWAEAEEGDDWKATIAELRTRLEA